MNRILIALLAMAAIVLAVLLSEGKFGRFQFDVGKDGIKVEVEAAKPATIQAGAMNTQVVQVGLNEEGIKRELESLEERLATRIDESQKLLKSGNQDAQKEINTLNQKLAGVQSKLADTQKALRDRKSALAEAEKALENEQLKSVIPEEKLAEAKQKLEEGDASSVEELFSGFMEKRQSQDEPWAEVAHTLGKLAKDRIDYGTAIIYFEQAVQLAPNNSLYLNDAGALLVTLAQYDKAIEYYEKALASDLKTFGPDHPNVAIRWNNLGLAWDSKGGYDKAIEYYEKALASGLKTFGPDHPRVAIYRNNLGLVWDHKGEYDKAIEYYGKALARILKTFGPDHPNVARSWNNLGGAWNRKGKYVKAIEYFEKALASDLKTFGPDHPNVAAYWNNLGLAWGHKGDYEKAIEYYEKALQVFEKAGLEHMIQTVKDNITSLKK